jgi:hypothetical protein
VLLAASCGGESNGGAEPTSTERQPQATATQASPFAAAQTVEADADPSLPGEFVDLPAIYGGPYGNPTSPNTNGHVIGPVDYTAQGLPPVGGPHWGSGACGEDPDTAPANCGPVPWGIFRKSWPAESLVHNLEHAGVVIWYKTANQETISNLEAFAEEKLQAGKRLVLAPYPDMEDEHVAITVWSRRDVFPVSEYTQDRLRHFVDVLYCRFDAEHFCS